MTLKSRNNVYFFFVILFAIITVISLVFFTVLSVQKKINIFSDFDHSSIKSILFYPNTSSAYFSILLLMLYSVVAGYCAFRTFENTQSTEIIYFGMYILGVFFNTFRIFIPLFNLGKTYNFIFLLILKACFAGQLMVILSFLFASIFYNEDQIKLSEQNFPIILAISIFFANIIPINIKSLNPYYIPNFGFSKLFIVITIICLILIIIGFTFYRKTNNEKRLDFLTIGVLGCLCGFFTTIYTSNYFFLILGTIFLILGTKIYLSTLHKYYLWK